MSPATASALGAVDLSDLGKPALPEGATRCELEGGCNLVVKGGQHETLTNCVDTVYPYVQRYLEFEAAAGEIIQQNKDLIRQQHSLLASNVMLVDKVEDLQRQLAKQ